METKDSLSSCSDSKEQQMQQIQDKAKKSCMVSFRKLHSHLRLLSNNDFKGTQTECGFKRAFATLFGQDVETFTGIMFLNMDKLEKQLDNEEFQEIRSMAAFIIPEFRDTLIQHMESVKKSIDKRALHKKEYDSKVNERQMQTIEEKVDTSKPLDDRQQHTEQPEINNEGVADHNAEQCHDTCPLPAILADNQKLEHSYQSLESENICLKQTVAQFQKDFVRMEAHCVNLELKYQNQALKEGQHGQFSKVTSNEAKHYKELYDSIKTTRARNIEPTTSLIAKNDEFKAQLQEKGFAIAVLKNELRKLKGNSVDTKFAKPSILGKLVLQPHRNQSVVRQPTAFKSERPRISNPRFAS
ncbi:hypothetical protein Tco_0526903 [Tanacetum coccineum]